VSPEVKANGRFGDDESAAPGNVESEECRIPDACYGGLVTVRRDFHELITWNASTRRRIGSRECPAQLRLNWEAWASAKNPWGKLWLG